MTRLGHCTTFNGTVLCDVHTPDSTNFVSARHTGLKVGVMISRMGVSISIASCVEVSMR